MDLIDNLDAAGREWNPIHDVIAPDPDAVGFYDRRRLLFEDVYAALVPLFSRLRA